MTRRVLCKVVETKILGRLKKEFDESKSFIDKDLYSPNPSDSLQPIPYCPLKAKFSLASRKGIPTGIMVDIRA